MKKSILCCFYKSIHTDGLIVWYENDTDEVVCMIRPFASEGQMWVDSVYVSPTYRKKGLCKAMLDYVTFVNGCDHLSVRKSNERAFKIYKKYGFEVYDSSGEYSYMSL